VLRGTPKARSDATEHDRRPAGKTGEGAIEVIELLERHGIIERRTARDHCATRDPVAEPIRGSESVLTAL
jgi:hypothetical protein